jgi:hypothetical protein
MSSLIKISLPLVYLTTIVKLFSIDTTVVNSDPENFEISWPSTAGKTYTINRSNDLTDLTGQTGGHEATPPTNTFIINSSNSQDYFVQVKEEVTSDYGDRSEAYAMNKRLGKGNNFMASKIQFGHAYLSDFVLLRESGFDHCRIGSNLYKYWGDETNNYANYKAAMKTAVDFAITAGLNAIVNPVHHWANDDLTNEDGSYTYRFEGSPSDFTKYKEIWADIANEFKDYPVDQVVFELMNEPHREYPISQVISDGLSEVRAIPENEKRIVIIAGAYGRLDTDPVDGGLTTREALIDGFDNNYYPTNDPYIIGTFHYYDPRPFTRQGNTTPGEDGLEGIPGERWGTQAGHYQDVIDAFDAVDNANSSWASRNSTVPIPIYQGEFGVDNAADEYGHKDRKKWLSWVRMQCEKRGYSWCHWHMYNNASSAKGLGPFDTSNTSSMVYFDFEEFSANDSYGTPAVDKVYGNSLNSTWGVPSSTANGFVNTIPADGVFQLKNNGAKPAYVGGTFGNGHRTEWGLSYHGFGDNIPTADRGRVENGFNHNSGKFTIEYDITEWGLTSADDSTVQFQARDASGNIVSSVRLVGKTNPIYSTTVTESSLVDFNFDAGAITDSATDADSGSLFALPSTAFIANPLTDGTYRIEKTDASQYFSGTSNGNASRSEWGLTYNGFGSGITNPGKVNTGFNKTSGEISIEVDVAAWDLSNGNNPHIEFRFLDSGRAEVARMRIKANNHTRLYYGVGPSPTVNQSTEHIPNGNFGQAGLKRSSEKSDSFDDIQTVKMKVDLDNDSITLTARGRDHTFENVGVAGANINTLQLVAQNFGTPDFITIDRLRIHDGASSSQQEITGYNNKTLVRAFDNTALKYAEHELDSSSSTGSTSHKLAINVDYDDGTYSLIVDDSTIVTHTGVVPTEPIHSVRLVTSNFQDPDYVNFDSVAFYAGESAPSSLTQTSDGYYGASFKDMPDLRYFDSEPLEALTGSYEFEDYDPSNNLTAYKGYSGSGYLDLSQNSPLTVQSVYKPRMSTDYNLHVRYASAQEETVNVTYDGVTTSHVFPSTGSLYDWGVKSILINTNAGEGDITISGNVSDSFNLDKAEITID